MMAWKGYYVRWDALIAHVGFNLNHFQLFMGAIDSLPTLIDMAHKWMISTNTGHIHWLSLH